MVILLSVLLLGAVAAALINERFFRWVLIGLLVLKPVIDCFWNFGTSHFLGQTLNPQSFAGVMPICLLAIAPLRFGIRTIRKDWLALFLFTWIVVPVGISFPFGAKELIRVWSALGVFLIAGAFLSSEDLDLFRTGFLAVFSGILVLCLLQFVGVIPYQYFEYFNGPSGRLTGLYKHPFNLGALIMVAHPLALLFRPRTRFRRWARLLFLGVLYFVLFFTFHRTTLLIVGLQFILFWFFHRRVVLELSLFILIFVGCVCFGRDGRVYLETVFSALGMPAIARRVAPPPNTNIPLPPPVATGGKAEKVDKLRPVLRGRIETWGVFLRAFFAQGKMHVLIGSGGSLAYRAETDSYSDEPHGDFVRLFISYGLAWMLAYLAFLGGLARKSWVRFRHAVSGSAERDLCFMAFVLIVCHVVMSIPMETLRFPSASWYTFALAAAAVRQRER